MISKEVGDMFIVKLLADIELLHFVLQLPIMYVN